MPSHVLEPEIHGQHCGDDDGKRHSDAGGPGRHETDDIRAGVAEGDPGAGPEQGAGRQRRGGIVRAEWRPTPASPAASGFRPGRNLAKIRYRTRCARKRSLASRMKESGSRENRHRVPSTRAPWDRPRAYQTHVGADGGDHRCADGQREVHLAGAGQGAGSEQHGDGRGRQPSLHGKRPGEEHHHAVLTRRSGIEVMLRGEIVGQSTFLLRSEGPVRRC